MVINMSNATPIESLEMQLQASRKVMLQAALERANKRVLRAEARCSGWTSAARGSDIELIRALRDFRDCVCAMAPWLQIQEDPANV